ncbi:penicillin amidase [Microbulbifer sp. GL-2]|nr:penicillin amidase [Microbulbifer sp. GL-2]
MHRRVAAGRLAEILGEEALPSDIFMRTLGLYKNAKNVWRKLPEREKKILLSYVGGVNEGIEKLNALPAEFGALQYKPELWKPEDSLVWMQLMSWRLSGNYGFEVHRTLLIQAFGLEKANLLLPKVDSVSSEISEVFENSKFHFDQLIGSSGVTYSAPDKYTGSNSWVVAGEHSKSGKPLLANDPHLANTMPAIWYMAELKGDNLSTIGATFPGLPFIVIGRNDSIAWGVTSMLADTQDIFLEKLNPLNRHQYEIDGEFLDMDIQREKIFIRKDYLRRKPRPHEVVIRRTVHGPVISDVTGELTDFAYSLRWTGDDEDGGTFSAFLNLNYASNWDEFRSALKTFVTPIHNFLYADKQGNIGYLAPGNFPIRKFGDGSIPTAGWLSKNSWHGWIPFSDVPASYNPERGYIVTANNKVVDDTYPYHLTFDWAPDYRADRISEELSRLIKEKSSEIDIADMKQLQLDLKSPGKNTILHHLKSLRPRTENQTKVIDILKTWDGKMSGSSSAAAIFAAWTGHYYRLLIKDDIDSVGFAPIARRSLSRLENNIHLELLEEIFEDNIQSEICDHKSTASVESCDDILYIALNHAINELTNRFGESPDQWTWMDIHRNQFPHFPFSDSYLAPSNPYTEDSILHGLFHREVKAGGGIETVNIAPYGLGDRNRYLQFYGPGYRQLIDLGKPNQSLFSNATGQSGNPISRHYDDLLIPHAEGRYLPMNTENSSGALSFQPAGKEAQ